LTPSVMGSWSGFWWALGLAPLVLHRIFSSIFLSKRPRIG
jgi:hypothetical protein